jgi:hypothetical protein
MQNILRYEGKQFEGTTFWTKVLGISIKASIGKNIRIRIISF